MVDPFLFLLLVTLKCVNSELPSFPFRNTSLPWDDRVNDLVQRLTLHEMMEQMAHELPRLNQGVPAIPRLGIQNYTWITECNRGDIRAGKATSFPQSLGLAATFDSDLVAQIAQATGTEVRAKNNAFEKQNMYGTYQGLSCLSPSVNIMRDPRWGRNQETYGEDPYLTGVLAQHSVQGLQGNHPRFLLVNSGCNHFDAYSGPETNPSRFRFDAEVSIRDLRTTFLPAFKKCVEAGTYSITCGYYSINGIPSCTDSKMITNILRGEWGFRGYVVSDAGAIEHIIYDHHYFNNSLDTVVAAINAGVNLAVASFKFEYTPVYYSIVEAVKTGRLSKNKIRDMIKPLWYTRMRLGEFDPPESNPYKKLDLSVIESKKHQDLAVKAAMKSFVLLKNKNFLPIQNQFFPNISIVGPMANDKELIFGSDPPDTDPVFVRTPLETLKALGQKLSYTPGCKDKTICNKYDEQAVADAVEFSSLVIVCLGLGSIIESEMKDRQSISLPGHQLQLLKDAVHKSPKGTPVMVILFNAGPVDISWADKQHDVVVIIEAFYPAQATGDALFRYISMFGENANPAARLPFTWPSSDDQIPEMANYSMQGRTYRYPLYEPLYPFGYGLSYTSFTYSNLQVVSRVQAGLSFKGFVDVTNTGLWAGDEVVQVYISWPKLTVPTQTLQLVFFRRLEIDTGQTITVPFTVASDSMSVWDDDVGWTNPKGPYKLYVGGQQPHVRKSVGSNVLHTHVYVF